MSSAPPRITPASVAQHVDALPPGTRLGEFEVVGLLGVGGFGMVYQAFDHSLLRFVAIKEYMPAALAGRADGQSLWVRSSSDEQSFQAGLASFVDEARLLAQFDHPSLVKVFRFWEANHTAYMVMPLYGGMTLKQARAHMRMPPPEAWLRKVLWSIASALRVLHEGNMLHRDISPDNIFLQDHGPPVLLDLGAARHAISDRRHTAVLKVNYAPIEQYTDAASHLQQGPWSDLYSLGAVVHGCLCNDTPLPATLRAIRDRMAPFPRVARTVRKQFGVEYSRPFVDAVAQCLALQPHDRPPSVDAFLRAMDMTAAPAAVELFDFRAELGGIWVEPPGKDAQGVAAPVIGITAPSQPPEPGNAQAVAETPVAFQETVAFADTRAAPEPPHGRPRRRRRSRGRSGHAESAAHTGTHAPRRRGAWAIGAMAGSLAVLGIAVGLWWSQPKGPRYTPEDEIITELAEPSRASAELLRVTHEVAEASPEMAPAPMPSEPVVAVQQPSPPRRAVEQAPPPEPGSHASAPPHEPAPVPAPRPVVPARTPGPDEVCASAGFFARPMCLHQECQKAGMAGHPVCVENRRAQEADERRRQMYSQ